MAKSIDSQLNESLRDALVGYYLSEVVPNDPVLAALGLNKSIKTTNDLYEYLLLDTQVSNDVQTSPVASGISSLQQYINGALLGMEPGHSVPPLDESQITEWRDQKSQYPIWAANQQLAIYPEIYIDPSLRLKKSKYFQVLENNINQNKIHSDTTQEAVQTYLASFEEVASLTLINSYIDSTSFNSGTYYFIGKSPAEKVYYWRTVNMAERTYVAEGATEGPKVDYPTPGAWSDWLRADIPVNENTVERTIRPVYFNNRLFVTWVDVVPLESDFSIDTTPARRTLQNNEALADIPPPVPTVTPRARLRLSLSYKKYDNTWSAPQTYIDYIVSGDIFESLEEAKKNIYSVTSFDRNTASGSLFVALYAGFNDGAGAVEESAYDASKDTYAVLQCVNIDKNFIPFNNSLFPVGSGPVGVESYQVLKKNRLFALHNLDRFQFPCLTPIISIKSVDTTAPAGEVIEWNYNDWQKRISDVDRDEDVSYNAQTGHLTMTVGIKDTFEDSEEIIIEIAVTVAFIFYFKFKLVVDGSDEEEYMTLQSGSQVTFHTPSAGPSFEDDISLSTYNPEQSEYVFKNFLRGSRQEDSIFIPSLVDSVPSNIEGCVSRALYLSLASGNYQQMNVVVVPTKYLPSTTPAAMNPVILKLFKYGYEFRTGLGYPLIDSFPVGDYSYRKVGAKKPRLEYPSSLEHSVRINADTLRPDWNYPSNQPRGEFYITYGVSVFLGSDEQGYAIKSTKIVMEDPPSEGLLIAPKVGRRSDPALGTVEFIDFAGSTIEMSDKGDANRQPIRMNTLFVRSLIERANVGLERLLSWETQLLEEPAMFDNTQDMELMDFHGANSLYFWELFLHLPFLISHRLNLELQFDQAETWLSFIFDPSRKQNETGRPDYWNVRPLIPEQIEPDHAMRAPIDPDGIASSYPVHYQKAVYAHYIKNLIDRGDMAYRQLTPDSLSEARLWYARVQDLLGPRPDTKVVSQWTPMTLKAMSEATDPSLRAFESLMAENTKRHFIRVPNSASAGLLSMLPTLRLSTYGSDPTVKDADNPYLLNPINSQLVAHWDTVASRIYNLGNNLTLDGKPLVLPLFAAPLDPRAFLATFASSANGASSARMLAQDIPHYRFAVMHNRANAAVESLIQFGNTLLSLIERKEQAEFQELQHHQAWEFAQFAIDLQRQTQVIEQKNREALQASQAIAQGRLAYYAKLSNEIVSAGEVNAGALHLEGRVFEGVALVARGIGGGLMLAPNHVGGGGGVVAGLAYGAEFQAAAGGFRLEGALVIAEAIASAAALVAHGGAEAIDRAEGYRRRHQEWMLARDQAQLEIAQIDSQLKVLDEQNILTAKILGQAQTALIQAKATYDFLGKRFTHSQLYQWLNGQYATFYYQAYDATLSLCMAAQASWQYELCDYTTTFIKPGAWSDAYRGLTAGESLKLNLIKMEAAYLSLNERRLEIIKTVSLRDLKKNTALPEDRQKSENESWQDMLEALKANGMVHFKLPVQFFDNDYPGQYQRRLTRVSVSLPAVVGPYQNIRAMLTQTYNAVQIAAGEGSPLKENLRASQQIALSTGVDDDGMFQLRFDDERYLPFEGTGAISNWTLSFPNHDASVPSDEEGGEDDQPMLRAIESLTDIIIRVSYTAKQGPLPLEEKTATLRKKSKALHRRSL